MTHDVTQWLAEIKALKQQLAQVQQDCRAADASAANWQKLYETEAQQRRAEAVLAQQTIQSLKAERSPLPNLQDLSAPALDLPPEIAAATDIEALRHQTSLLWSDRLRLQTGVERLQLEVTRLTEALKAEQANHAQTRKSLTTALGDTFDLLTKERAEKGQPAPIPPVPLEKDEAWD